MFKAIKQFFFGGPAAPYLDEHVLGLAWTYVEHAKKPVKRPERNEPKPLPEPKLFLDDTDMPPVIKRERRVSRGA